MVPPPVNKVNANHSLDDISGQKMIHQCSEICHHLLGKGVFCTMTFGYVSGGLLFGHLAHCDLSGGTEVLMGPGGRLSRDMMYLTLQFRIPFLLVSLIKRDAIYLQWPLKFCAFILVSTWM
jgi:hypothetical protein